MECAAVTNELGFVKRLSKTTTHSCTDPAVDGNDKTHDEVAQDAGADRHPPAKTN